MKKSPLNFIGAAGTMAQRVVAARNSPGGMAQAMLGNATGEMASTSSQEPSDFQSEVTNSLANITEKLDTQSGAEDPTVNPASAGDASINTFSDSVSQSGAGIYGSQDQRQRSVGYPQDEKIF